MAFTFDDTSRCWVIYDTSTRKPYYQDVHNLLAAPEGWVLRYEYRKQWLTPEVIATLTSRRPLPSEILLCYVQRKVYSRGDPDPTADESLPFEDHVWVPTRWGQMLNVVEAPEKYFFDFKVGGFPPQDEAAFRRLYAARETPFWKWVGFTADRPAGEDGEWRRVVEVLSELPSQFAGDVFWQVANLRPSRGTVAVSPASKIETLGDTPRRVSASYPLTEDKMYLVDINSTRSRRARGGGQAQESLSIKATSTDTDAVRVVGSGVLDLRQYTGVSLHLAAKHRAGWLSGPAELELRTEPMDAGWPQGPILKLLLEVKKNWPLTVLGLVCASGAAICALEATMKTFAGGEGWDAVLLGGASVLMGLLGASILTGTLTTKP